MSRFCVGIEMGDEWGDIRVVCEGLEAESVFESNGEGENEVHGCDFREEIFGCGSRTLIDVDPEIAG